MVISNRKDDSNSDGDILMVSCWGFDFAKKKRPRNFGVEKLTFISKFVCKTEMRR